MTTKKNPKFPEKQKEPQVDKPIEIDHDEQPVHSDELVRKNDINESTPKNYNKIYIGSVTGVFIIGLGVILYYKYNKEKPPIQIQLSEPKVIEQPVIEQPKLITEEKKRKN